MNRAAEIFPPGEFLRDELEARNWSQTEFAEIIGRPVRLVNEVIAGKKAITPETAIQFAASLGTSAELWLNLESQYQLSKVRQADDAIQRKARLYERFPVRDMVKRGWIDATDDIDVLEQQFLSFYRLPSLDDTPCISHAAKKSCSYANVSILQASWLCRVIQIAESFAVGKYRRELLISALNQLKPLLSAPEEIRHVPKILIEAGVRFVLVEALPGSKIDGACLWLSDSQPVIAMSARLDRIDNFWFVLRHEIEHLIQEHGKEQRVMLDEDISESDESALIVEEKIANEAASQFAVPSAELEGYMARVNPYFFAEERVLGFAGRLGVHPGLVVGRLQKRLEKTSYSNPYKYLRGYLVKVRQILAKAAPTDGWSNVHPVR